MYTASIFIFSIILLVTWISYSVFGKKYALDFPNKRKHHHKAVPQIGGLVFGPFFLLLVYLFGLAPVWYLIGGLVSIIIGAIDDLNSISWQLKLIVQLILATYIANLFWDHFDAIIFYNFSITLSVPVLFFIFLIWFVGIYNAVNLLDGLDGLAGGFMFILSAGLAVSDMGEFSNLNRIFAITLLSFLIFNQRPAKIFMGDAGSLFLGFHVAVLPLLFADIYSNESFLYITPFVLIASYLVADTTRVFFTRIAARKSPMTADTIHFHHLIHQQSRSYLAATGSIYLITLLYVVVAVCSFKLSLSNNIMIGHLALLLLFVLTPLVQTYVPLLVHAVKPIYDWQKKNRLTKPLSLRTIFIVVLFLCQVFSFYFYCDLSILFDLDHGIALFLIIIFSLLNNQDKMTMYVIQLAIVMLVSELTWQIELDIFSKLFTSLICVSYIIFTLERRTGTAISRFSSLDLLTILIVFGGIILYLIGLDFSPWFFTTIFSIWFSVRFLFLRTIYFDR